MSVRSCECLRRAVDGSVVDDDDLARKVLRAPRECDSRHPSTRSRVFQLTISIDTRGCRKRFSPIRRFSPRQRRSTSVVMVEPPAMLAIGRETEGNGRASRLLGLDTTHRHGRGAVFSAGSAQWTLPCPWLQSDRGLVRNGASRMVGSVHRLGGSKMFQSDGADPTSRDAPGRGVRSPSPSLRRRSRRNRIPTGAARDAMRRGDAFPWTGTRTTRRSRGRESLWTSSTSAGCSTPTGDSC